MACILGPKKGRSDSLSFWGRGQEPRRFSTVLDHVDVDAVHHENDDGLVSMH